jgi:hypothetical protein
MPDTPSTLLAQTPASVLRLFQHETHVTLQALRPSGCVEIWLEPAALAACLEALPWETLMAALRAKLDTEHVALDALAVSYASRMAQAPSSPLDEGGEPPGEAPWPLDAAGASQDLAPDETCPEGAACDACARAEAARTWTPPDVPPAPGGLLRYTPVWEGASEGHRCLWCNRGSGEHPQGVCAAPLGPQGQETRRQAMDAALAPAWPPPCPTCGVARCPTCTPGGGVPPGREEGVS